MDRLGTLVSLARNGHGSALLVRGEAGIGKTTLLEEAVRDLGGVRVVRADGFEAESAMAYATLQRLGAPFAHLVRLLPERQAAALRIAAGVEPGPPPDRYLVGLGMLSLLAAAAEHEPIVCVVDDAHLADAESLEVLAFVARRLQAEAVTLILSARPDPGIDRATAGVASLDLAGLEPSAATQLLHRSVQGAIDPLLAKRIADETGGNPLALIDLGRAFSARELTETTLASTPVPIGERLERHYLERVQTLGRSCQDWLLIAAAESTGDLALIEDAAARLALPADSAAEAERADLVVVRSSVAFRHPLVRAAVYNGMPGADRRRIHEVLAAVADDRGRADLAVWHAAAAAIGIDEVLAGRMEELADAAGGRGGSASRSHLLARAADLTPLGAVRDARLLASAEAAAEAGAAHLALEQLDRLDVDGLDPVSKGRALLLEVTLAMFVADPQGITHGTATLLRSAELFHGLAPELEQRALLQAFEVDLTSEWAVRSGTLRELGERLAAGAHVTDGPRSLALAALSSFILDPYEDAVPAMRGAVEALLGAEDAELLDAGYFGVALTMGLWDEATCVRLLERQAEAARDAGALRILDTTLWLLSLVELVHGGAVASGRYAEQVRELRRAIGYDAEQVVNAAYFAWSGAPIAVVVQIADAVRASGFIGAWTVAMSALSSRDVADGNYREAYERSLPMIRREYLQVTFQQIPDFVEAGVRSGMGEEVRFAVERLVMFADVSATPWIRGLAARSAALLAPDDEAEAHYRSAIDHLEQSTARGDLGRAHLVYGEWLRRMKRRREAREQLRTALSVLNRVGSAAFEARARRELEATGEHVPVHGADEVGIAALTPQEASVARMAAVGRTNAEIGSALFISVNTVDYHLRKVFRKVGVTSRRQLSERLPTD